MIRNIAYLIFFIVISSSITVSASSRDMESEVLLMVKDKKILAFSGIKSHWVEIDLKMNERVISKRSAGNVAIVVTDIRLLGYSTFTDQWRAEDLMINEIFINTRAEGNVATVETDKRVLGFSARSGEWVEPSTK